MIKKSSSIRVECTIKQELSVDGPKNMLGKLLRGGNKYPPPDLPFAFSLASDRQLRVHQNYDPVGAWRFLSHQIRRYPQDLRAHTQRILLAQSEPLREYLAGSLQDVFLALGNGGKLLREHLFNLVKDDLGDEDQLLFQRWLQDNIEIGQGQRWRSGSVLSAGQEGAAVKLVDIERTQESAQYSNIMEEVFACLEYGQVDTARELLEAEVLAGTSDEAMEQELVNIYQYTRNQEGLSNMIRHMEEAGRNVPAMWREKQQESEQW